MNRTEELLDLYGALWLFCSRYHTGQGSRGYRILSRLCQLDYRPGFRLEEGQFESTEQKDIYRALYRNHRGSM